MRKKPDGSRRLKISGVPKKASTVRTQDNLMRVKYHNTDVVSFNNDEIILDSGGWATSTTKTRMNQVSTEYNLGYSVSQRNYDWYVQYKGKEIPFSDGMSLNRKE